MEAWQYKCKLTVLMQTEIDAKHEKFKQANTSVASLNTEHEGTRKIIVSSSTRTTTKSGANIDSRNHKMLAELP